MLRVVVYVIELAVGLACVVTGVAAWRRRLRTAGAILALAGTAAIVHAIVALVSEGR